MVYLCASFAERGRCSVTCTPGTLDGSGLNWLRYSGFDLGLGSKVSIWLTPPFMNNWMTRRTFGPHVHVELYPAGVKPGDPYEAINPAPWLNDHGLNL